METSRPTKCAGSGLCFAEPGLRRPAGAPRRERFLRPSSFPHTSLVYDWIGSPRVTNEVADAIRAAVPELSYGAEVVFDGVALVDMRGRSVGEWEILDRISLAEPGCDEPIAATA